MTEATLTYDPEADVARWEVRDDEPPSAPDADAHADVAATNIYQDHHDTV